MTAGAEPRTSRTLPAVVVALFGLVLVADLAVLAVYRYSRDVLEENQVEIGFEPRVAADGGGEASGQALAVPADGVLSGGGGRVLAERVGDGVVVRARGELVIRFRVADAGARLELDYRFLDPEDRGRCEVTVGRVASRHGVDVVRRLRLAAVRRPAGTFRHNLADHVGWFEVRLKVNGAAARGGFEVGMPRIVPG